MCKSNTKSIHTNIDKQQQVFDNKQGLDSNIDFYVSKSA